MEPIPSQGGWSPGAYPKQERMVSAEYILFDCANKQQKITKIMAKCLGGVKNVGSGAVL